MSTSDSVPTYADVCTAAERIKNLIHRTPVLSSRQINNELGFEIFFKCENFQKMGSFKFRGAVNAVSNLSEEQRKLGVFAHSSGNHAQSIAYSTQLLGVHATVLMPLDAPLMKVNAVRNCGAEVIRFNRYNNERDEITDEFLGKNKGVSHISSFETPDVITGNGTAVKELIEEVGELDAIFVPIGSGGLIAGSSLSAAALSPNCKVYGAEPVGDGDARLSLKEGRIISVPVAKCLADGALTPHIGEIPFKIIQKHVEDIFCVSDSELVDCLKQCLQTLKIYVEPTACLGFAAAKQMKDKLKGKKIGVVLTGGNMDLNRLVNIINEY